MGKKRFAKCFISAPAGVNTTAIIDLLKKKGISASDFFSLGVISDSTSVESEIANADFLVAILSSHISSQNVFYEIGLARGSRRPIFLIAIDEGQIPYFLKDNVYLKANLSDSHILSFYLDKFLSKNVSRRGVVRQDLYSQRPSLLGEQYFGQLKDRLYFLAAECRGIEFSHFLEEFFENQGFVVESSNVPDIAADMSIWIDSLEQTLGNPILVEAKCGKLSETLLEQSERQLRGALRKSNLRSGMLIYLDSSRKHFRPSKFALPLVIRFEISDLIEKITKEPLDCVLLNERNKIAHGGIVE